MATGVGKPWYEVSKAKARQRTADLKAAGGAAWEAWKQEKRLAKAKARANKGRQSYDKGRYTKRGRQGLRLQDARQRAAKRGIEFSIRWEDIDWVEVCPVFGMPLNYMGGGSTPGPDAASLDRKDNTKGYVPGNVYIISHKANTLKNASTVDDLKKLLVYMEIKTP